MTSTQWLTTGMVTGSLLGAGAQVMALSREAARGEAWARDALIGGAVMAIGVGAGLRAAWWAWAPFAALLVLLTGKRIAAAAPPSTGRTIGVVIAMIGVASGILIGVAVDTAVFAPWWRGLSAAQFGGHAVSANAHLGVIAAAKVIACAVSAHYAMAGMSIAAGPVRTAARRAAVTVVVWFVVDSGLSLASGAAFNVLWINLPSGALAIGGYLLAAARA